MRRNPSRFVKESYINNDTWAIRKVKLYLAKKGYALKKKKKEDYDIDIVAYRNNSFSYFEVEVKRGYPFTSKQTFPFDTVSFLGRKKKWRDRGFWYIIVCRETEHFVTCHSDTIFQKKFREKLYIETSDRHGSDVFYRVPKDKCYFSSLDI